MLLKSTSGSLLAGGQRGPTQLCALSALDPLNPSLKPTLIQLVSNTIGYVHCQLPIRACQILQLLKALKMGCPSLLSSTWHSSSQAVIIVKLISDGRYVGLPLRRPE